MNSEASVRVRRSLGLGACVLALAAHAGSSKPSVVLRPDDPQVVKLGAKVYQARCAVCHGAHLEGQPNWRKTDATGRFPAPPHDASGHTWHHPDDLLFRITKYGVAKASDLKDYDSAMPAFDGVMTDAEIIAVLSWIKAQWPPEIRKEQDEVNAEAAQLEKR
ncbi:MAG: cytochrome c [Pseudomonadota bacterium]|nr:cytochrome c [Pseudomonadota bacterium]